MENGMTQGDMLRTIGLMAVCVGVAWAAQVFGLGYQATSFARLMWLLAVGSISGAGVGLVLTARDLSKTEAAPVRA